MIELPKRIGNISDTDYLQEQINSMKHQLDNSVGGNTTTIANLSVENLEVKGKIDMGKNTSISWLNIKDADDVATQQSVEETKKAIEAISGSIPRNYVPYTTDISGNHVISEYFIANNLKITGGEINIQTGSATKDHITLNYSNSSTSQYYTTSLSSYGLKTRLDSGARPYTNVYGGTIEIGNNASSNVVISNSGMTIGGKSVLKEGDAVSNATNATYAAYGYHTSMTSNMYVGVNQSASGNYRSFGYCGRTDFQSWLNSSSSRFKHDIKLLSPDWHEQIHRLYDLEVKSWTFNEDHLTPDDEHQGRELIGIIAEELEEVMPNAVLHDKDGNVTSYSDRVLLNAMLVLLQEQNERIKVLEEALEQK